MHPEASSESIDELLDRAILARNLGDRATATALAGQVLAVDQSNPDAEALIDYVDRRGEIRRLALMFVDLVDSTVLSRMVEPETYRTLVGSYRDQVARVIASYQGHILSIKGDGLLVAYGYPTAIEDDARRAVASGLEITRVVSRLSAQAERKFGVAVRVRVGIHRGVVYLDAEKDDIYGFAVNFASRISDLAAPGTVAVSDTVATLIREFYDLERCPDAQVKGVPEPVVYHRVLGERVSSLPAPSVPLVGRSAEQDWLREAWGQVCGGAAGCAAVAFRGEAGIGKTRLARAVAELVDEDGGRVVELRGSPLQRDVGLHPVRRLLERQCGITRLTAGSDRLRLLETEITSRGIDPDGAIPLLAPVLGVGSEYGYQPAAADGKTLYQMIGATVGRYITSCLEGRPGLIIAEDVHWFDPSTIEILDAILTAGKGSYLAVMTGRDGTWLKDDWPVTLFQLGPLTDEQSNELIASLSPGASAEQCAQVRSRCDGVPFYIEHVVAALNGSPTEPQVPEALYAPLIARLQSRAGVVPVAEAAAVIGRSGDISLLSSTVGSLAAGDIHEAVTELTKAGVFVESPGDGWRFRHELLRELALELAPPSRRRELHSRVAQAMLDAAHAAEPDWREVAVHFEQAEQAGDAVDAFRRASVAARHRGALAEATALLTSALTQLESCDAGSDRDRTEIAIRLERGFLANAVEGSWDGAGPADFERCLALASDGNYSEELFDTLSALIGYYIPRAELRRAHNLIDSLSMKLPQDRPWSYVATEASLGSVLWMQGEFAAAGTHLRNALERGSVADPAALNASWWVSVDPISVAHVFLALTAMVHGEFGSAETEFEASLRRCDALSFPENAQNQVHTIYMQVWVHLERGQLAEAIALTTELRALSKSAGFDFWRFVAATVKAAVHGLQALAADSDAGALDAAAAGLAHLVDGARLMNLNSYLTFHDAIICRLYIAAGTPERAQQRVAAVLQHTADNGMNFYDAELMRIRAHTYEAAERVRALDEALALARSQGARLFELRCLLDRAEAGAVDRLDELAAVVQAFEPGSDFPELLRARRFSTKLGDGNAPGR